MFSLRVGADLRVGVRISGPLASELRVDSGLATGAVNGSLGSPVQRNVNCRVGP